MVKTKKSVYEPRGFATSRVFSFTYGATSIIILCLLLSGMFFWDYGNAFLLEARRAGADVLPKSKGPRKDIYEKDEAMAFRYPSYVQDIMGQVYFFCQTGTKTQI